MSTLFSEAEQETVICVADAKSLIAEVRAVGGVPFFADALRAFIEEVPRAFMVPDGSMSYLCVAPYYFVPEEVSLLLNFVYVSIHSLLNLCNVMLVFEINSLLFNRSRYLKAYPNLTEKYLYALKMTQN